jgi:hypothetical protein
MGNGLRNKKWWHRKPQRNWPGMVPKVLLTGRRVQTPLLTRVQSLVKGNIIERPVWLDAALAHPPSMLHLLKGEKPTKLAWREEDRLRRIWQRRNPSASMHPKVLFVDESQLPADAVEHPADAFINKQMELMRTGFSEDEAYRRVALELKQKRKLREGEAEAARADARGLGATPAAGGGGSKERGGFAEQLLRRFAEEARSSGQPYPRHWFADGGKGSWRGIGAEVAGRSVAEQLGRTTERALERAESHFGGEPGGSTSQIVEMMGEAKLDDDIAADAAPAGGADEPPAEGGDADGPVKP